MTSKYEALVQKVFQVFGAGGDSTAAYYAVKTEPGGWDFFDAANSLLKACLGMAEVLAQTSRVFPAIGAFPAVIGLSRDIARANESIASRKEISKDVLMSLAGDLAGLPAVIAPFMVGLGPLGLGVEVALIAAGVALSIYSGKYGDVGKRGQGRISLLT